MSFAITAWLVVSILLVYYIGIYNADLDPFRPLDDISTLSLAFSMITLQPVLQAVWVTCTLWISKAAPRKFVAGCIQSLVFFIFISICSIDLSKRELQLRRESSFATSYLILGMTAIDSASIGLLLMGYIILSAWVNLDLRVRQQGAYSYKGCIWRILTGLALIAVAYGCMAGLGPGIQTYFILGSASILGFQSFWLVLEFSFERLAISRIPKLAIRGGLIVCVVILLFLATDNRLQDNIYHSRISLDDKFRGLCLSTCIYGMWVIFWPATHMLAGRIILMFRRIL